MNKKIKIAWGLFFGICSLVTLIPITVSCSSRDSVSSDNNGNNNSTGGNNDSNNDNINTTSITKLGSAIYSPNQYSDKFISNNTFKKIKNNLLKSGDLVYHYYNYWSKSNSGEVNGNKSLKNIKTTLEAIELIDSKFTIEFIVDFDGLSQENENAHSRQVITFELNLEPTITNDYQIKQKVVVVNDIVTNIEYNISKKHLDTIICFFKNNTSIFLVPPLDSWQDLIILQNNFFDAEYTWIIISNIYAILANNPDFYNDKTLSWIEIDFSDTQLNILLKTTNYETEMLTLTSYSFRKQVAGDWLLYYSFSELRMNDEPEPETLKTKTISDEHVNNFFKQIYNGNKILSFDEI